ncbi:MAG: tetratricopeptide repeat protein [Thermodesulfobacteriota bacterium]
MAGRFILFFLSLVLLPLPVFSNPNPPESETSQFSFAEHLLQDRDYDRAITEFKRYLFLYPSGHMASQADYLLGEAFLSNKLFKEAIDHWEGVLRRNPGTPFREEIQFQTGKAYWELRQEDRALALWEKVLDQGRSPIKENAARAILWALIKRKQFNRATEKLIQSPLQDWEKAIHRDYFQKAQTLPYLSPATAGLLAAVLPGAGHWYLGRRQDALIAFSINGLFTWAAVSSFEQGNKGLGTLLAVIELAWYSGNIYSAVNSAHKYNRKLDTDFWEGYGIRFGFLSKGHSNSHRTPYLALHRAF